MAADKNFISYADVSGVLVENQTICPPDDSYSDALKLSHASDVVVRNCIIIGKDKEDCIDMNRFCANVRVEDTILEPYGLYGCTIKGGTKRVYFKNVVFNTHGKSYDIDLGNWSDQSSDITTEIYLDNVTSRDNKPVRVRVLWADNPIVTSSNVKVIRYPRWVVKAYRWLRARHLVP